MQHQQLHPQPPGGSHTRPSWERAHALTAGSAGGETDQGLLKALVGLQTPQASQRSRLSQGSAISLLASPAKKVAEVAAHKPRNSTMGDVDRADVPHGAGHNGNGRENRSFFQGTGNNDTGEAEAPSASSSAGRVSAEGQRSKRKHGIEEEEIRCTSARVRHAGIANADLDIDVEAASPPTGRNSTTDPARVSRQESTEVFVEGGPSAVVVITSLSVKVKKSNIQRRKTFTSPKGPTRCALAHLT